MRHTSYTAEETLRRGEEIAPVIRDHNYLRQTQDATGKTAVKAEHRELI